MQTHILHLDEPHFSNINKGLKCYELRIFDDKRKLIKVGDDLIFKSRESDDDLHTTVTNIKIFASFHDAILYYGVDNIMPGETIHTAVEKYHSIKGYAKLEREEGIIAMFITIKTNPIEI